MGFNDVTDIFERFTYIFIKDNNEFIEKIKDIANNTPPAQEAHNIKVDYKRIFVWIPLRYSYKDENILNFNKIFDFFLLKLYSCCVI